MYKKVETKPIHRYLEPTIRDFLEDKMVFIGGPRQVGKTTLCLRFLKPATVQNAAYLNWDDIHSQGNIRHGALPDTPLVVLDEIHKFKNWRNLVKGFYDKKRIYKNFSSQGRHASITTVEVVIRFLDDITTYGFTRLVFPN